MKTFLEFTRTSRKYIAVIYDDETQKKLRKWCTENGFDLSKNYDGSNQGPEDFEFHTTIMYSENETSLRNKKINLPHGKSTAVKFKLLGENEDIPVLVIDSPDLKEIRSHYENLGLRDKWPEYIPHISLSYVRKTYDLNKLKLPDFELKFDVLKIEDIDETL